MESMYQQLLTELGRRGYPKRSSQTPYEYVDELERRWQADASIDSMGLQKSVEITTRISQAYVQWRYGGTGGMCNRSHHC
ncbi:MAG: DUF4129 domain-containing protein [Synechococcales cyanobacterium RU_4_20]|nr:DUF4129 domain-containing protein [Synechococcales cyanobacterium RU_4_20]